MNQQQRYPQETYYEVLGIDSSADSKTIRQAYLKQAVKYHPDKNPADKVDQAKARFVEIGHAYQVLSDPNQRAMYDRELRNGTYSNSNGYYSSSTNYNNNNDWDKEYESYRDTFDAHVAGMSEAEVAALMGLAAVVGSVVGSLIAGKCSREVGGGNKLLSTVGSMAGSFMASQAAADMVRSIHQQSVERVEYKKEQQRVQSGESFDRTYPSPPCNNSRDARTTQQSYGQNNNYNSNNTSNDGNIGIDDILSAVDAGIRIWKSISKKH